MDHMCFLTSLLDGTASLPFPGQWLRVLKAAAGKGKALLFSG